MNWRIIDPDYQNNGYEQCRKEFKALVDNKVVAFTTEQAYFNKLLENNLLADNDKNIGSIVVLAINPLTELSKASYDSDCMLVKGKPIKDIGKANVIYLIITGTNYKEYLDQVTHALDTNNMVAIDCVLKCSVNEKSDNFEISFSQSKIGKSINNKIKPYLEKMRETCKEKRKEIKLIDISECLDEYLKSLNNMEMSGIKIYASEYDKSIAILKDCFMKNKNTTLFASFDKNESRMTYSVFQSSKLD